MIVEALSSTFLSTILILLLVALFKNVIREWLVTRIRSGIQHDFDKDLESHKAQLALQTQETQLKLSSDLQTHRTFLDAVRASFTEGQKSSMERKLVAVEKIWAEVLELRKLTLPTMTIVDVFKETEIQKFREVRESNLGDSLLQRNSVEEYKERLQTVSPDLEVVRPFVGEYLWILLNCYRAIHLRLFVILQMFMDDEKRVIGWFRDEKTYEIISAVLDEQELARFNGLPFGKFLWLIDKLEVKMLAELRHIVSGQHFAQDTVGKIDSTAIEKMAKAVSSARSHAF